MRKKRKPYGHIYKLTFPNGKVYVGQTIQKIKERWGQHKRDAFSIDENGKWRKDTPINRAIRKYTKLYGFECIKKDIIDVAYTHYELQEKEILVGIAGKRTRQR